MSGLIHIYTGDGKGKTSAATGLAVRCAGSGRKVLYAQFLKKEDSCELPMLDQLAGIERMRCEKCFGFTFQMSEETKKEARRFYTEYFQSVVEKVAGENAASYGLLVLDELVTAYAADLVEWERVLEFLQQKPEELEIAMTGRNAMPELIELADYVSEIRKVKHPFDRGIGARRGIEM